MKWILPVAMMIAGLGCEKKDSSTQSAEKGPSGMVRIDGSSTVFPITEGVAEEFQKQYRDVKVLVGISGTGGGFKKFLAGETDINNASRPIKDKEITKAKAAGIEYLEIEVAYDGLSVVVNPENTWVESLTLDQLKRIWEPDSKVKTWKDVNPTWPDREIKLYGPGPDSGTFDYFTETVVGKSGASRPDYTASEDDNVLVKGLAGDKDALGYFGYAYYAENAGKLKVVGIDGGKGPVKPTMETVSSLTYAPLSRPLFIYVRKDALAKEEVKAFVQYYVENAASLVNETGYVPVTSAKKEDSVRILRESIASMQLGH